MSSLPRPQEVAARSLRIDRQAIAPLFGIRVTVVVAGLLAVWLATGHVYAAIWFALGAQYTAMTDSGGPLAPRLRNMAAGALAAGVSVCVGALLGSSELAQVVVVTLWGIVAAIGIAFGEGRGKVGIVAAFSLIGVSQFTTVGAQPLLLALAVVGGGAVQIVAAALWRASRPDAGGPRLTHRSWAEARQMIGWSTPIGRHAIRMAVGLAAAVVIYEAIHLDRGAWVGIAVLLILRPSLVDSADRTFMRFAGTLLAVTLVTGLVGILGPSIVTIAILAAVAEGVCFAFARAQYAIQSGAMGAAMVLLFSLTGAAETALAGARILDTLVGGLIAAAVTLLVPEPKPVG